MYVYLSQIISPHIISITTHQHFSLSLMESYLIIPNIAKVSNINDHTVQSEHKASLPITLQMARGVTEYTKCKWHIYIHLVPVNPSPSRILSLSPRCHAGCGLRPLVRSPEGRPTGRTMNWKVADKGHLCACCGKHLRMAKPRFIRPSHLKDVMEESLKLSGFFFFFSLWYEIKCLRRVCG